MFCNNSNINVSYASISIVQVQGVPGPKLKTLARKIIKQLIFIEATNIIIKVIIVLNVLPKQQGRKLNSPFVHIFIRTHHTSQYITQPSQQIKIEPFLQFHDKNALKPAIYYWIERGLLMKDKKMKNIAEIVRGRCCTGPVKK